MRGNIFNKLTDITWFLTVLTLVLLICFFCCVLIDGVLAEKKDKKIEMLEHKCDSLQREIDLIAE